MEAKFLNPTNLQLSFTNFKEYSDTLNSLAAKRTILRRKSWDDLPFDSTEPPLGCLFRFSYDDDKKTILIEHSDTSKHEPMKGIEQAITSIGLDRKGAIPMSCLTYYERKSTDLSIKELSPK